MNLNYPILKLKCHSAFQSEIYFWMKKVLKLSATISIGNQGLNANRNNLKKLLVELVGKNTCLKGLVQIKEQKRISLLV